ncbi:hypothetical protein [Methylosinus sp. R-45379]|uniref:hypothetical protein n=1 Tax=Methylosinus sp. R-45379 TaxID=980563 RepID=UPI000ABBC50D|nr:hypothetical protein [Methylosinus sp. R-45379]
MSNDIPFYRAHSECRLALSEGRPMVAIKSLLPEDDHEEQLFEIKEFYRMAPEPATEAFEARLHNLVAQVLGGEGRESSLLALETEIAEINALDVSSLSESEQFAYATRLTMLRRAADVKRSRS